MQGIRAEVPMSFRRWAALLAAGVVLLSAAPEAAAQDALIEAFRQQRAQARATQVLTDLPPKAVAFGPMELPLDFEEPRRFSERMPLLHPPALHLPPMRPVPERPTPQPPPSGLDALTEIRIERTPPGNEAAFLARFGDALWASATGTARTELDTMPTPEARARLHTAFGVPTRSPVARGRPEQSGGSVLVQFEYWFVVNDSIPFVVMDRNGPFGRGLALVADEAHLELVGAVYEAMAERLMAATELMPYVDYYQSGERGQWYRTGYDGERYYTIETERPQWARRSRDRSGWYEFR
jgi:hypothetical protein